MKSKFFLIVLLAPISLWGNFFTNDFQFWFTQSYHLTQGRKIHLVLENQNRIGNDASRLFYYYIQGFALFQLNKYLEIGPGYRQIQQLDTDFKTWVPVYTPMADMVMKLDFGKGWTVVNRQRIQCFIVSGQGHQWQYRNRFTLHIPWKIGTVPYKPQIEEEFFFREDAGFFENRFAVGLNFPEAQKWKITVLYMLRYIVFDDAWWHQNVAWTRFELVF